MQKIETFEQFLTTGSAQFSSGNYLLNLFLTALLSYLLGLLYHKYGQSLSNRKNFASNFVMLAVTTMIIITIVKSSLALSLGLVGALSIVRFRAAIKEPEELTYLFLNIAIGLGFGADQKIATILGFIFISIFLLSKKHFTQKNNEQNQNLIISISVSKPEKNMLNSIIDILKENCAHINLKRVDENVDFLECSFILEYNNFDEFNNSKIALQEKYKNISISLLDNNLTI